MKITKRKRSYKQRPNKLKRSELALCGICLWQGRSKRCHAKDLFAISGKMSIKQQYMLSGECPHHQKVNDV